MPLSRPMELATTAVVASIATATLLFSYQAHQRRRRTRALKREIELFAEERSARPEALATTLKPTTTRPLDLAHEEQLLEEQLSRNISFLGKEGVDKLRKSFVIVVGAGGVGSWAALMLARSGIGRIRVIDFDQVTLSSLNRHAVATRADVGTSKVVALQAHLRRIVPLTEVDARVAMFSSADADELLQGNPDYVLDCIDNIDTKVDLLTYCHQHQLPVISSMGAGAKADPSRIQLSDISDTFEDPLARAVRRRLKMRGILSGITTVYSIEKPGPVSLLPLDETQVEIADEYAILPEFRVRILPVLGPLPAMFGMAMATFIICKLAGHPIDPLPVKLRGKLYDRLQRDLINRENNVFQNSGPLPFNRDDIAYIVEEVWRGKSGLGTHSERICLTRWDKRKPLSFQNCICLTRAEADRHDKYDPEKLHEYYTSEQLAYIQQRFEEERVYSQWR